MTVINKSKKPLTPWFVHRSPYEKEKGENHCKGLHNQLCSHPPRTLLYLLISYARDPIIQHLHKVVSESTDIFLLHKQVRRRTILTKSFVKIKGVLIVINKSKMALTSCFAPRSMYVKEKEKIN